MERERVTLFEAVLMRGKEQFVYDNILFTRAGSPVKTRGTSNLWMINRDTQTMSLDTWSRTHELSTDVEVWLEGDVLTSVAENGQLEQPHNKRFRPAHKKTQLSGLDGYRIKYGDRRTTWLLDSRLVANLKVVRETEDDYASLIKVAAQGAPGGYIVRLVNNEGKPKGSLGWTENPFLGQDQPLLEVGPNVISTNLELYASRNVL